MAPAILFVFAHPDDESFLCAGTTLEYREQGVRIVLVTMTRGDKGKRGDPEVCTAEALAVTREGELRAAASIVGFDELHLLDYRDRELAAAPPDEVRRRLVAVIRRVRPLVVGTFDPNGFNAHPDHVAVSRFTSDAVAAAGDSRWHPEFGPPWTVPRIVWSAPVAAWDAGIDPQLAERPGVDFVLDVERWAERREAALRAHRSQHLSIDRVFLGVPRLRERLAVEAWRQAWGPPLRRRPSADLLESLR